MPVLPIQAAILQVACSEWLRYIHGQRVPSRLWSRKGREIYRPHQFPQYDLHRFDRNSSVSFAQVQIVAQDPNFYKFAVVRHPWDRINSAYRSKYEGQCRFDNECFRRVFVPSLEVKDGIYTFHEVVKALSRIPPIHLDGHFRPQTLTCDLTTFPYDEFVDLKNITQMDLAAKRSGFKTPFSQVIVSVHASKRQ
eukprot:m.38329 g.38329  ORF g.38329 m.38329 type:complete len:194 (+) comp12588_c0_seq19:96-677(+)